MLPRIFARLHHTFSKSDVAAARQWLAALSPESHLPPPSAFAVTYSRSSGPGGQNVNKVSSKATLKLPQAHWGAHALWMPPLIRHILFEQQPTPNFSYQVDSGGIVVQSDKTRSRSDNLRDCQEKLVAAIKSAVYIPPDVKQEDVDRWNGIKGRAKEVRLKDKKMHSQKKSFRKSRSDD